MKKRAILLIDCQNDFCLPSGALSVNGAVEDCNRIAAFIRKNVDKINHISLTLDSHHEIHIAHPCFWKDANGNNPTPFSTVTASDVKQGKWTAQYNPIGALHYLEELEKNGGVNVIWNPHCILGTEGWAIVDSVMSAVREWEVANALPYNLWFKGSNWYTEHFSIFKASVVLPNAPETNVNHALLSVLNNYDEVYIAGEAKSHCVAESLNDIIDCAPDLAKKVFILDDCMSAIGTDNPRMDSIFEKAKQAGVKIVLSTDDLIG